MKSIIIERRHLIAGLATAPLLTDGLSANAGQSACTADRETKSLLNDWPNLSHYALANQRLLAAGKPNNIVFMGDSITQGWLDKRPDFFPAGRVCRGIGGQTSGQMVLRMMSDVIALNPDIVHIMAGTNDIAGNTGPMTARQTVDNVAAMILLAKVHRIKVLVGSILPASNFPWRPGLETVRAIASLNQLLAEATQRYSVGFVDYTVALSDGSGGMKPGFAYDGVHPDTQGYKAMEAVLEPVILDICDPRRATNVSTGLIN